MRTRRRESSSDPVPAPRESGGHRSVLLHEVVQSLAIEPSDVVLDMTLGGGGHAHALNQQLDKRGILIGFDADSDAVARANELVRLKNPNSAFVVSNFRHAGEILASRGITRINKALYDLGWSSYQLSAGRGFSFQADEPLAMTYEKEGRLTAAEIVNEWDESSIADILYGWGEERHARRFAKAIVERREKNPFKTARELADFIRDIAPPAYKHGRIHPATRTFQALRIATNDEFGALSESLEAVWPKLAVGGRMAIITFHSVEDRFVKRWMVEKEKTGEGKRVPRKPITPTEKEIQENPRARSAKLRVIEKISS